MCSIERFSKEAPPGKSLWKKENILSLVHFFSPDEITKIKICYMVAKEHTAVIEGRRRLIAVGILDSEVEAEYSSNRS